MRGRREATLTCLLFIDLDDFKIVNDTSGHSTGDQLLTAVGERLSGALRRTDTAARLGGDEFAVLMEDAQQPLDAELLAAQVIQTLSRPFPLLEGSVSVSASVGVATARDSTGAEELLGHADLALYAAKAAGKRQWRRFQPELRVRMVERHDLQARLDRAISGEEFALRYQPVVDIRAERGGRLRGTGPLAAGPPHGGRPQEFISLAEETGAISQLGAWVLEKATAEAVGLQHVSGTADTPYISVNVSARQFGDTGFLDEVRKALGTPGLAPGSLQLELTETVLMRRDPQIEEVLRTLREMGVHIAVDDFGTGFSSLGYLRDFPIDVLKIDKSFIDDITLDTRQVALVEGMVNIADTLGIQVIAEGIEDPGQRDVLAEMGCRFGQGFLFARPMTAEQGAFLMRRLKREAELDAGRRGWAQRRPGRAGTGRHGGTRTGTPPAGRSDRSPYGRTRPSAADQRDERRGPGRGTRPATSAARTTG